MVTLTLLVLSYLHENVVVFLSSDEVCHLNMCWLIDGVNNQPNDIQSFLQFNLIFIKGFSHTWR